MTLTRLIASAALALAALGSAAQAQYPERDVTVIVGYSAGGGTDIMARTVTPFLEKYLPGDGGFNVDNRPGAGGERGFTGIAQAEPDGYTIGMLNIPSFINPIIQRDPAYTIDSFAPIANVVSDATSLVVRADSEFETLEDWVTYVRENPSVMPVGNSGLGGASHTSFLRFLVPNDLEVTHVPFPGSAPSRTALLGGHVAASVMGIGEAAPLHEEGQLRVLATMRAERWDLAPDIPTFREQGYNIVAGSDRGIGAPAGIPDDIRDALVGALEQMMQDTAFLEAAAEQTLPLSFMGPEEHGQHMRSTYDEMKAIWDSNPWVQ